MAECKSLLKFFSSYNASVSWFAVLLIFPAVYADTRGSSSATGPDLDPPRDHIGWHEGSTVRGTWSILWTCLTTLFITIWTVIHNEVEHNGTERDRVISKLNWMFYTALQPQHTTLCAADQWIKARSLHQFWCKTFNVRPDSAEDRLGRKGAYFIIMGGYTVGPCDYLGRYPPLLDSNSFKQLLEDGSISSTSINQKLIEDRGKADAIAKTVTLIQAIGLAYTCIVRLFLKLPITLLEIHVVIHVAWAAIIYTLWWNKPLGVHEPISIIEHEEVGNALAILYPQNMPLLMAVLSRRPVAHNRFFPTNASTRPPSRQSNASEAPCPSLLIDGSSPTQLLAATPTASSGSGSTAIEHAPETAPPFLFVTPEPADKSAGSTSKRGINCWNSFSVDSTCGVWMPNEALDVPSGGWYIPGNSIKGTATRVFNGNIENVVFVEKNRSLTDIGTFAIEGWTPEEITQRQKGDSILILPGESLVIQDSILIKYCGLNSGSTFNLTRVEIDKLVGEANEIRGVSENNGECLGAKPVDETVPCERRREYLSSFIGKKVPKRKIKLGYMRTRGIHGCLGKALIDDRKSSRTRGILALTILCNIDAAAHFIAWRSHFPSFAESQIWRICCIGIIVVSWYWAFITIVFLDSNVTRGREWLQRPTGYFNFAFGLFFVIESFIALRRLPGEAFRDAGIEDIIKLL